MMIRENLLYKYRQTLFEYVFRNILKNIISIDNTIGRYANNYNERSIR